MCPSRIANNVYRVKHPLDGETSHHFSTNQMNCYIDDTISRYKNTYHAYFNLFQ